MALFPESLYEISFKFYVRISFALLQLCSLILKFSFAAPALGSHQTAPQSVFLSAPLTALLTEITPAAVAGSTGAVVEPRPQSALLRADAMKTRPPLLMTGSGERHQLRPVGVVGAVIVVVQVITTGAHPPLPLLLQPQSLRQSPPQLRSDTRAPGIDVITAETQCRGL